MGWILSAGSRRNRGAMVESRRSGCPTAPPISSPRRLLHPPELKAQFQGDGGYNYFHRTMRHSGAFELGVALPYVLRMARESQELAKDAEASDAFTRASGELEAWMRTLPLRYEASPLRFAPAYERWFLDMLRTSDYEDYWKHPGWNLEEHIDRYPDLPIFFQTSWYGHHVWATTERFNTLRRMGPAPKKLLIGHWTHGYDDYERSWCGEVGLWKRSGHRLQRCEAALVRPMLEREGDRRAGRRAGTYLRDGWRPRPAQRRWATRARRELGETRTSGP